MVSLNNTVKIHNVIKKNNLCTLYRPVITNACKGAKGLVIAAVTLRVLSLLVHLPGPNPSSFAPPSPRWTAFILFYLGLNRGSFASSSQQMFTPLLSNEGAGEGSKMHKIALCTFTYLHF